MPQQEMSNFDYHYLVNELAPQLLDAHLNKAYELRPGVFRLQLRTQKEGRVDLVVELGVRAHLTRRIEAAPQAPTRFATAMRGKLGNARVLGVEQVNLDRVLKVIFKTRFGTRSLLFELLKGGNAILLDEQDTILDVYEKKEFEARTLARGHKYVAPPTTRLDPRTLPASDLDGLEGKLTAALSKKVNIPPVCIQRAITQSGIDPESKSEEVVGSPTKKGRLVEALRSMLDQKPSPAIYTLSDGSSLFSPVALEFPTISTQAFPTFSDALDAYYSLGLEPIGKPSPARAGDKERTRLQGAIEQQRKSIELALQHAATAQLSGKSIFSNAAVIQSAIDLAKQNKDLPEAELARLILKKTGLTVKRVKEELEIELPG